MADVALFHSALGLRRGVLADADRLRAAGHRVHTPDLFDGDVFDDFGTGTAKMAELGVAELRRRTWAAVEGLPGDLVYVGFSMGAASAQYLAANRPGARGAVLVDGARPVGEVSPTGWPGTVPVQVHYHDGDPWVDADHVAAFGEGVRQSGAWFEQYAYAGSTHLFADPDLPGYQHESAELMWRHVLDFLAKLP